MSGGRKAHSLQARRRRQAWRRALLRRLSHVTARLERTPEYRDSWQRVLDRGGALQAVLQPEQRERWLEFEEALFDHSAQLQRAYFLAGVEFGQSRARATSVSGAETSATAAPGAASAAAATSAARAARGGTTSSQAAIELEILIALARWLGKLMRQ